MLTFKRKYTINMIGKAIKIGDRTTDKFGHPMMVVGITSVSVEGEHIVVEGYGTPMEY